MECGRHTDRAHSSAAAAEPDVCYWLKYWPHLQNHNEMNEDVQWVAYVTVFIKLHGKNELHETTYEQNVPL
jgi:hypothetical protein